MNKNKLLVYLLMVFVGVAAIDAVFRLVFSPIFDNPPINTKAGATYRFVSYHKPANLVILGASRATHHYRSEQIEDSLNISVYNYGGDGRSILYQYLCLLKAADNGDLRTVILDLSPAQIGNEWVEDRISDLYPFYWKNDTVRTMVDEVEKRNIRLLMLSSLIQYNSQYLNLVAPMNSVKGYIALPYTGIPVDLKEITNSESDGGIEDQYNEIGIKYLSRIVSFCRDANINIIVCLSPSLVLPQSDENYMLRICMSLGVECWNMTHDIIDPYLFSDYNHLNDKGANLFTMSVVNRLKDEMDNSERAE